MLCVQWPVPATCLRSPSCPWGTPQAGRGLASDSPFLWLVGRGGNEHLHGGICTITWAGSKPEPPAGKSCCWLAAGNLPQPVTALPQLPPRVPASCAGPKHML